MAAPGLGIGDLVGACRFIWRQCVKYKDAPKEFDEIAEKAKSTEVVLGRIDAEAKISGNLVERAGPQAVEQLEANLQSLRRDSKKLEKLVSKYNKIHDEGPGRRLLFALKESSDLTDLRRRIGLHEQTLQLWYMTLVYSSLRRLEGNNEKILEAIDVIKDWNPRKVQRVRSALYDGDSRLLDNELRRSGVQPNSEVSCNAAEFVMADTAGKVAMESREVTTVLWKGSLQVNVQPRRGTRQRQRYGGPGRQITVIDPITLSLEASQESAIGLPEARASMEDTTGMMSLFYQVRHAGIGVHQMKPKAPSIALFL